MSHTSQNPNIIDVIIPAYNEEDAIGKVLDEIPNHLVRNAIVCNNGSTDSTKSVAQRHGAIVVDEPISGYGRACLAGMAHIAEAEQPADIVVFLDGDYSDYPVFMTELVQPIIADQQDMVIGSRALGNLQKGSMTTPQVFGNWLATNLIKMIYGYQFTDLGPFRAIRYSSLLSLNMVDKDFGWTVEMQVKAAKQKLRCTELAINYRKRIGKSKVSGTIKGTILAGHKILWTIFKLI